MLVRISTMFLVRNPFPSQPIVLVIPQTSSLDTTAKSVNNNNNRSIQSKIVPDYGTSSTTLPTSAIENHSSQQQDLISTDIVDNSFVTAEEHLLPQDSPPQNYNRLNTADILLTLSSSLIQPEEESNLLGIPPHLLIDQEPVLSESLTQQESIDLCHSPIQEEQTDQNEQIVALDVSTFPLISQAEEVQDIMIPTVISQPKDEISVPVVTQEEAQNTEEMFIPVIAQEAQELGLDTKEEPVTQHVISESPIQEELETALATISEEEQEPTAAAAAAAAVTVLLEKAQESIVPAATSRNTIEETEEENTTLLINTSQITEQEEEPQKREQDLSPKPVQVPEVTLVEMTVEDNEKKNEEEEEADLIIEISEAAPVNSSFLLEKSKSAIHSTSLLLESDNNDNKPVSSKRLISKETMDDNNVNYYTSRDNIHSTSPLPPRIENMTPSASTPNRKRYSLYAAIGTRIHPRSSLDDSKGMPVFQPPTPTVADKLKPKTMLKRLKTIVKNNKKKSPTL